MYKWHTTRGNNRECIKKPLARGEADDCAGPALLSLCSLYVSKSIQTIYNSWLGLASHEKCVWKTRQFVTRMEMTSATCGTLFYTIAQPGRQDQFVIVKTKMSLSISSIPRWNFARVAVTNKKTRFQPIDARGGENFLEQIPRDVSVRLAWRSAVYWMTLVGFHPTIYVGRLDVGFLHGKKEK